MRMIYKLTAFMMGMASLASAAPATTDISPAIRNAVADSARSPRQIVTDPIRKPAETLAFAGVKPGMTVGEFFPGGGYFTQMLGDVVGTAGHVFGIENAGWKSAGKADQALIDDKHLTNVSVAILPFGTVSFPRPLDLVWVTQNYHDLKIAEYGQVDTEAFNRSVFAALKPGGVYFILDHEAPAGTDVAGITKLHRIEKAQVIREVTAAGFRLVGEGNFLRQPGDDHGVSIFDKKVQGHTHQYALKFIKPKKYMARRR